VVPNRLRAAATTADMGFQFANVRSQAQNAAAEARARSRFQITDEEIASSVGTFLGDIMASGAYPRVRDVVTSADRIDPQAEMKVSVELILDGAAARIAAAT